MENIKITKQIDSTHFEVEILPLERYIPDNLVIAHDYGYGLRTYYEWGVRHYWYNWIVSILFILQVIRTIVSTAEEVEKIEKQK